MFTDVKNPKNASKYIEFFKNEKDFVWNGTKFLLGCTHLNGHFRCLGTLNIHSKPNNLQWH